MSYKYVAMQDGKPITQPTNDFQNMLRQVQSFLGTDENAEIDPVPDLPNICQIKRVSNGFRFRKLEKTIRIAAY